MSKAFDCLLHDLLIAKLHAYGLDMPSFKLLSSYLSNRKQRSWEKVIFGALKGSIVEPLLFNIFLYDLLLFNNDTDIANYADDNTPNSIENTTCRVTEWWEECSGDMFTWFF